MNNIYACPCPYRCSGMGGHCIHICGCILILWGYACMYRIWVHIYIYMYIKYMLLKIHMTCAWMCRYSHSLKHSHWIQRTYVYICARRGFYNCDARHNNSYIYTRASEVKKCAIFCLTLRATWVQHRVILGDIVTRFNGTRVGFDKTRMAAVTPSQLIHRAIIHVS